MFLHASSQNRVVSLDLSIRYFVDEVKYTTSGGETASWFKARRIATKLYEYVDLTEKSARTVANEVVANYTRPYSVLSRRGGSESYPQSVAITMLKAEVTPVRVSGAMWKVTVSVCEEDVRASATRPADPASLFSIENARSYDDAEDIVIASSTRSGGSTYATISYQAPQDIDDDISLQYKASQSGSWVIDRNARHVASGTIVSDVVVPGNFVRLVSGVIESNVVETEA